MKNKSNADEIRYHMLRAELDKMKFYQAFDYKSMDLIEALMKEIMLERNKKNELEKELKEVIEKKEELVLGISAYKHQNNELFKENNELHNEILTLLEKKNYKGKDLELKRLNEDTNSLKYLLNASKEKNHKLEAEIVQVKQKYIELIDDIYEKKLNINKIFNDIQHDDQIELKPRNIEKVINNYTNPNSFNNNISINHNSINSNSSTMQPRTISNNMISSISVKNKVNNKQLVEKIYALENELKDKDKEIYMLKKNIYSDNVLEQKVVIDYLKDEIKHMKEKYECYLKFQIEENSKVAEKARKKERAKLLKLYGDSLNTDNKKYSRTTTINDRNSYKKSELSHYNISNK